MKKNNSSSIHANDQLEGKQFHSEPFIQKETQNSRRKFDNQYNNAQYLVHPEKTYTQTILNLIFGDNKTKSPEGSASPEKQGSASPQSTKQSQEGKSSPQTHTKSESKTKTSSPQKNTIKGK